MSAEYQERRSNGVGATGSTFPPSIWQMSRDNRRKEPSIYHEGSTPAMRMCLPVRTWWESRSARRYCGSVTLVRPTPLASRFPRVAARAATLGYLTQSLRDKAARVGCSVQCLGDKRDKASSPHPATRLPGSPVRASRLVRCPSGGGGDFRDAIRRATLRPWQTTCRSNRRRERASATHGKSLVQ
jgi:hypothetical protein